MMATLLFLWITWSILNILRKGNAQFSSVQSLSCVRLFAIPWIATHQASLSVTISRSSLGLTSVESVMPSSHLILGRLLLLLPPVPPSIRVFSNESTLRMRWPKYWSISFSISPSMKTQGWSPLEWIASFLPKKSQIKKGFPLWPLMLWSVLV